MLLQNLYITYSNQKARELKKSDFVRTFDKVLTLDTLILELFEKNYFETIIDENIASGLIYQIIKTHKIEYFSYLFDDSLALCTIYSFIVKCKRNEVSFDTLLEGEKLKAITLIDKKYQEMKKNFKCVDISDIERIVSDYWDEIFENDFQEIYLDSFGVGDINYVKSKKQRDILDRLSNYKTLPSIPSLNHTPKLFKPSNEVFDTIDEVKTALKIARKLLEEDNQSEDILIVATDISEYAPLYKLFLDEYGLKGFSSLGTPLSAYFESNNEKCQNALKSYKQEIKTLSKIYEKFGLTLSENTKKKIKANITIVDDKIGIELTEPNQLVGLSKRYKHIIFLGTDINHFPPKSSDNFLYSYEDDMKYFCANNYFTSSKTQLDELKRLSENLYIITASYSGKRELSRSILLDGKYKHIYDISTLKSINDLALENQTILLNEDIKEYFESLVSEDKTQFDGMAVVEISATHLSASQINSYNSCPLAYLYSNKIKIKAPRENEDGFDHMEQGSLMHLCFELFGKEIKARMTQNINQMELYPLMYQKSIEAYNHNDTQKKIGTENIHHQIFLLSLQAGLQDDREKGLLAKFVDYYIKNAKEFNYFQDTEFEKEFALDRKLKPCKLKDKEDKNYFIKGFIDRFDNLSETINIIDYKSKKAVSLDKKKQKQIDEQKDIQLALYILYASQEYPNKTYNASLLSFKGNEKGMAFASLSNKDENGSYTKEYEENLNTMIFQTKENIETGNFGFDSSDETVCGYCDFKFMCHSGVLRKGRDNNINESGGDEG